MLGEIEPLGSAPGLYVGSHRKVRGFEREGLFPTSSRMGIQDMLDSPRKIGMLAGSLVFMLLFSVTVFLILQVLL